ncbi:MAG: flagellar protein FlaG [Oscillospiraceae bacterium]|nr:flagellar protein FlaG [Oscillospiraceae bacterium]
MIGNVSQLTDMISAAIVANAAASTSDSSVSVAQPAQQAQQADAQARQGDLQGAIQQQGLQNAARTSQQQEVQEQQKEQQKEKKREDEKPMDEASVSYVTKELNELMARINCNLQFKYHKELDTMSVKMVDKESGKVLKEVPPEDLIKHMIKAKDWLGAFLDKKA